MVRRRPAAQLARSELCRGTSACRTFLKAQTGAVDPADSAPARVENLQAPSRLTCSQSHRLSRTTRYRRLGVKDQSRSFAGEIGGAVRASIRDRSCCQPESALPLRPSKDLDAE